MAIEHLRKFVVLLPGLLQAGFALADAEDIFFNGYFQFADTALLMRLLGTQGAPAQ